MFLFVLDKYLGVEWLGYVIDMFNFLSNLQPVCQSDCTIFHLHQHCHQLTNTWYGQTFLF